MAGPSGVMDWCSPPRLKPLIMFLLTSTNFVCLHGNPITGVDHLHCVNNYLFTINCSLSIAPSDNTSDSNVSYWLTLTERHKGKFVCQLTKTDGDYFCSVQTNEPIPDDDDDYFSIFGDTDIFKISLCHNQKNGSETCERLVEDYEPEKNIKLNAPCCLTVSNDSGRRHFTWKSTYEEYANDTNLVNNMKYQLRYYRRGGKHHLISQDINTDSTNYSVDDDKFEPDTEYSARVRSSPNQAFYEGEWSDWSSEVHWRMGPAVDDQPPSPQTFVSGLGKVFIPLCVMVPLVLLLCYAPVKRWKQSAFIPTPAPYFDSLYSDCQGDFKSWVVTQENTADMLKTEETLQIDTLSKCEDIQEEEPQFHHHFMEGSTYTNIPGCDTSLLGVPYAVSTMTPPSAPGSSVQSLAFSSQPGSPAEGDSGCWLSSHTSLERDPPWYCNEYCTLSAFQQTGRGTAEHHPSTKSCSTGIMRVDAVTEA